MAVFRHYAGRQSVKKGGSVSLSPPTPGKAFNLQGRVRSSTGGTVRTRKLIRCNSETNGYSPDERRYEKRKLNPTHIS